VPEAADTAKKPKKQYLAESHAFTPQADPFFAGRPA
jgi:hypothetical protein